MAPQTFGPWDKWTHSLWLREDGYVRCDRCHRRAYGEREHYIRPVKYIDAGEGECDDCGRQIHPSAKVGVVVCHRCGRRHYSLMRCPDGC
jgi:DNA-directed RNA polymerase subunit RPC12/RpoP